VGNDPGKYHCTIAAHPAGRFAKNDLVHEDPSGCYHQSFALGLNKAVYNFMHGIGMDLAIKEWFDFHVPAISVKRDYVERAIKEGPVVDDERLSSRVLWIENQPCFMQHDPVKKGDVGRNGRLVFTMKTESFTLTIRREVGEWLNDTFPRLSAQNTALLTLEELKQDYETRFSSPFRSFLRSREWKTLREKGLLLI
jgi:hypothetical protein